MRFICCYLLVVSTICAQIPTIDFKNFVLGNKEARQDIADDIANALTTTGFFLLKNHGTSRHVIENVFNASYHFAERPLEEKKKFKVDVASAVEDAAEAKPVFWFTENRAESYYGDQPNNKEQFVLTTGANDKDMAWGHLPQEFQIDGMFQFMFGLKQLSNEIFRAYALALGVDEEFFASRHRTCSNDYYAFNYYPPLIDDYKGELLLPPHSDFMTITLGFQDEIGGLQIWNKAEKKWLDIAYDPDVIIVNTGDGMERWSNGKFVSNNHRVVPNTGNKARMSFYFFIGTDPDCIVDPRDTGFREDAIWKPITFGDMLLNRVNKMVDVETFHDQEYGDADALKQEFVSTNEGHGEL